MRKIIEDENEGLLALIGERITVFSCRYTYTGKLIGVNNTCIKLSDGGVVFETGSFDTKEWEDYQKLPNDFYVQNESIESFMILK